MAEKVVIGNAELWHGDCREILPTLQECDLILTDPPYGIGVDVRMKAAAGKKSSGGAAYKKDYGETNWDSETPERAWTRATPRPERAIGEAQRRQGVPRHLVKHERRRIYE